MSCHICAYLYYILHIKHFACQTFYHITCNTFYMTALEHLNMPSVLHHLRHVCLSFTLQSNNAFSENNGFQILWQHVADSCSGCLGRICSKGAILAVILHPKGKAMDGASISFREEQGLMFRKGLDFPNSFHSGWGQLLTKANFNPP